MHPTEHNNPLESGSIHITLRSGHYIGFRLAGVGYYETSRGNRQLFPNLQAGFRRTHLSSLKKYLEI